MKNRKNIDTSTSKELPVSISKDTTTKASLSGIGDGVKNHLGIELSMLPKDVFRNPEYRADLLRFPAKGSVVYHFDGISALIGRDIFRTLLFGLPLESYQLIMEIKDLDDVNSDKNRDVM